MPVSKGPQYKAKDKTVERGGLGAGDGCGLVAGAGEEGSAGGILNFGPDTTDR